MDEHDMTTSLTSDDGLDDNADMSSHPSGCLSYYDYIEDHLVPFHPRSQTFMVALS